MPNKDPNFLQALWIAISSSNTWLGAMMASSMTWLRIIYDDDGNKERNIIKEVIECTINGALTVSIASILDAFNLPSSAAIFVGGFVGLLGVNRIRSIANKLINKKIDNGDS